MNADEQTAEFWKSTTKLLLVAMVKSDPDLRSSVCPCCASKRAALAALEAMGVPEELDVELGR